MYTLSSKLKLTAIILVIVGAIGLVYGFISTPSNEEELKELLAADAHGEHGAEHDEASATTAEHGMAVGEAHAASSKEHGETAHAAGEHGDSHMEHLLHQFQTKPWSALFVSAFFFFMISLGVLAFYAIQRAAQAGWSPLLFRVMEGITASSSWRSRVSTSSHQQTAGLFVRVTQGAFLFSFYHTWTRRASSPASAAASCCACCAACQPSPQ